MNGRRYHESTETENMAQAVDYLRNRIGELSELPDSFRGKGPGPGKKASPPGLPGPAGEASGSQDTQGPRRSYLLALALADYQGDNGITLQHFFRRCIKLAQRLGNSTAGELDEMAIWQYERRREDEGISRRTVSEELTPLRQGLRLAWQAGLIEEIPDARIDWTGAG